MRLGTYFIVGLAALALAGCSASSDSEGFSHGPPPSSDSPPGSGVLYEGESPLTLAPSETTRLDFVVTPPGRHAIRFALMGDSGDASLDTDFTTTASDGRVSVELKAPSSSRTFKVRASLDSGSSVEVPVSVSGLGFGKIEVVPSYEGKRSVARWVGTVATGTSCAELLGIPPPDGPLVSQATPPRNPLVQAAPVGPALVVTVRAGQFAGGCMDVKGLTVGETKRVSIPVLDRPLDLSSTDLSITLGVDAEATGFLGLLEATSEGVALAFATTEEANSWLDEMAETLPTELRPDFDELRKAKDWDGRVAGHLEARGLSLRTLLAELLLEGARELNFASGFQGRLQPGGAKDVARYIAESLFAFSPSATGMVAETFLGWSATPDDVVHLGGEISFSPTALVAKAAWGPALAREPGASSVEEALASSFACEELALSLDEGDEDDPAFADCDAACLSKACEAALARMWKRATSAPDLASLTFTASGDAKVGNAAEITGFLGSWVGSIAHGELSVPVKGKASGL